MGDPDIAAGGAPAFAADRERVIEHLRELIEALDRRVPRLGEQGEVRIADEAAALRQKALERIAELQAATPPGGGSGSPTSRNGRASVVQDDAEQ
jgi:hypothetical protein